jgi:hypothetical protein
MKATGVAVCALIVSCAALEPVNANSMRHAKPNHAVADKLCSDSPVEVKVDTSDTVVLEHVEYFAACAGEPYCTVTRVNGRITRPPRDIVYKERPCWLERRLQLP